MRKLPIYFLIDTSGSMYGERIRTVNTVIQTIIGEFRKEPSALETAFISIITFNIKAEVIVPLTGLIELGVPTIETPQSGPAHMGLALETLSRNITRDIKYTTKSSKGDWAPFLFIMTDGKPSDTLLFKEQCERIKSISFKNIVGIFVGPKNESKYLHCLCDQVISIGDINSAQGMKSFIDNFFNLAFSYIEEPIRSCEKYGI